MSWSRCFSTLVVSFLLLTAAVVPAAAVATSKDGVPEESKVSTETSATYTFDNLYTDYESWTLHGETNLTGVTWTVRKLDQAGNQVSQQSYDGGEFNESVDISENTATVEVTVRGTVPEIQNFSYAPDEQFTFARFQLLRNGGSQQEISTDRVHHYTEESKEARAELNDARQTIDAAGGDAKAEKTMNNAISAYNGENFGLAVELANEAASQAEQSQASQNRMQLLLYGAAGLLALLLVVGGIAYYRSQQDNYDKLR